jgi:hypothetical protein
MLLMYVLIQQILLSTQYTQSSVCQASGYGGHTTQESHMSAAKAHSTE